MMWGQVSLFAAVVGASVGAWWYHLPFTSAAVVKLPARSSPARVAPAIETKLKGKVVLDALAMDCGAGPGRLSVHPLGEHDLELAFSCPAREGARKGVQTLVQQVLELGLEGDVVVERPVGPVSVQFPERPDTILPNVAGFPPVPSTTNRDLSEPVRGPMYMPDASTSVQVTRPASEPERRWFRH